MSIYLWNYELLKNLAKATIWSEIPIRIIENKVNVSL